MKTKIKRFYGKNRVNIISRLEKNTLANSSMKMIYGGDEDPFDIWKGNPPPPPPPANTNGGN